MLAHQRVQYLFFLFQLSDAFHDSLQNATVLYSSSFLRWHDQTYLAVIQKEEDTQDIQNSEDVFQFAPHEGIMILTYILTRLLSSNMIYALIRASPGLVSMLPAGQPTVCYWKLPFIDFLVDLPI